MYDKAAANIVLKGKKLKPFPLRNKAMTTLNMLIQHSTESPSNSNRPLMPSHNIFILEHLHFELTIEINFHFIRILLQTWLFYFLAYIAKEEL